jgi:hypothetical protein
VAAGRCGPWPGRGPPRGARRGAWARAWSATHRRSTASREGVQKASSLGGPINGCRPRGTLQTEVPRGTLQTEVPRVTHGARYAGDFSGSDDFPKGDTHAENIKFQCVSSYLYSQLPHPHHGPVFTP